jgi:heptose-I-phosphate ethanolaminephosphotransferase
MTKINFSEIKSSKLMTALLFGCFFALMMAAVSGLEFFLPTNGADITVFYKRVIVGLGFNLIFSFVFAFTLFVLPEKIRRIVFIVVALVCVVFITASVLHFYIYKQLLAAPSLMVLLDTDVAEATEFLGFYASAATVALGIISFLLILAIAVHAFRLSNKVFSLGFSKTYALVALISATVLGYVGWDKIYFTLDNPIPFVVQIGAPVVSQRAEYKKILQSKPKFSNARMINASKTPATHLIIIGESATNAHMSVYGYDRETNPNLKKPVAGMQMLIAQDACSSRNATFASIVEIMLGSSNQLKFEKDGTAPSNMVSIIQDAGYKTYWISNQPGAGYGSMVSFWSASVDKAEFLNKRDYRVGYDFDGVLLPSLKTALNDEAPHKVIVLHMMGSHPGYKQRYPKIFEQWSDTDEVPSSVPRRSDPNFNKATLNAYDNSILYSDYIIAEILRLAKTYQVESVVYFSDHGQNLGEKNTHVGHSTESGPKQGFEVPLIFWINNKSETLIVNDKNIKENLLKPYSLERIQYTLFDLYGISLPKQHFDKSLFSDNYQVIERRCDQLKD